MFMFCSIPESRGVSRSSRTRGGMRWTRKGRRRPAFSAYGRSRVVLARPCTRQARARLQRSGAGDGGKSWFTGKSTEDTVKPLRREGWRDAADTCCCRALAQPFFAREPRCLAGTRSSLRPRCFRGTPPIGMTRALLCRGN